MSSYFIKRDRLNMNTAKEKDIKGLLDESRCLSVLAVVFRGHMVTH